MSGIELCVLPAVATDVHVSVVHTAVGSPCTYRKRVLYIAFTHVPPSLQFVARFVSLLFTYFPKVCGRSTAPVTDPSASLAVVTILSGSPCIARRRVQCVCFMYRVYAVVYKHKHCTCCVGTVSVLRAKCRLNRC
jgi:hypothetical protein